MVLEKSELKVSQDQAPSEGSREASLQAFLLASASYLPSGGTPVFTPVYASVSQLALCVRTPVILHQGFTLPHYYLI